MLVTNGGFALFDSKIDAWVVQTGAMGVAIGTAAKHKLFGLLAERLHADEITVGEVMVMGHVRGTAWDPGNATIEPPPLPGRSGRFTRSANLKWLRSVDVGSRPGARDRHCDGNIYSKSSVVDCAALRARSSVEKNEEGRIRSPTPGANIVPVPKLCQNPSS